jgi:hypothetical protein
MEAAVVDLRSDLEQGSTESDGRRVETRSHRFASEKHPSGRFCFSLRVLQFRNSVNRSVSCNCCMTLEGRRMGSVRETGKSYEWCVVA